MNLTVILISMERIFPIFILIVVGFIIGKVFKDYDYTLLGKVTLYVFATVLSFTYVNMAPPKGEDLYNVFINFTAVYIMCFVIMFILKKLKIYKFNFNFGFNAITHINAGYIGYPIIAALYGEQYIKYGVIFSVVMTLLTMSVGIIILSGSIKEGLTNVIKLPIIHAFLSGWILGAVGIKYTDFPPIISTPIEMIKQASITLLLMYIGISLSRIKLTRGKLVEPLLLTFMKLFFIPVLGVISVMIFPMDEMPRKIFLIQCAMPTAMNFIMIASELNIEPENASLIIFLTTMFSLITMPIWTAFI